MLSTVELTRSRITHELLFVSSRCLYSLTGTQESRQAIAMLCNTSLEKMKGELWCYGRTYGYLTKS